MVSVSPNYIIQFKEALHMEASQTQSRLSKYAKIIPITGEKAAYDGLGTVEASEVTGQYQAIKFANIEHLRRRIIGKQYIIVLPVDEKDVVQKLTDPSGDYAKRAMEGMKRRMDKIIYDAALASVYTGKDMDTVVTAANDGVTTVNATSGLTKEKLDEINENYIDNEISVEEGQKTSLSISGEEHTDLMSEVEFLSIDYNDAKPIVDGRIKRASGMEIELFGANSSLPILNVASSVRDCLSMASDGVVMGLWKDMDVKVQERADLVTTHQIVVTMYIGATRTEGARIQKVQTTVT